MAEKLASVCEEGREKSVAISIGNAMRREIYSLYFSLSCVAMTSLFAEEPSFSACRKADVSNTRANIHTCALRTKHKCAHRSAGFCLLRRSNVAPTNCSRTVPRDMNFLTTLWLHLPFSSRLCLFCYLSSSPPIPLSPLYPRGEVLLVIYTGWVDTQSEHDGNVDVRWQKFKIEFFLAKRMIYPWK